ncbi:ESX secretion-associated protein EspG [Nocardioides sp. DS6]|uniref:ESX secretion-associated protein EspG n=1 Tax=Nocardioides eburneus TaxID=3231482 RepID=A0ABV3SYL7_9ACTN
MTTIDLGPARPALPDEPWAGAPRRIALTLPELTHACSVLDAPLPFEVVAATKGGGLEGRLGQSRSSRQDDAFAAATAALGDPAASLTRRGLLDGAALDAGLAGALGLLAAPEVAIDLDVTIAGLRAHAWHRRRGDVVATLATSDGLVFELSWFPADGWSGELGRTPALPEDISLTTSQVPDHLEVPFGLADAVFEATRAGRGDLVPVLTSGDATLTTVLTALTSESRGRLRAIVASVSDPESAPIGVVSWTLVGDGWRALRPVVRDGEPMLTVTRVEPSDLGPELAPVLAEVIR